MQIKRLFSVLVGFAQLAASEDLPSVDLGYEIHQAIAHNSTGCYYTFSNIRYAQPPIGQLRFAAPVPPEHNGRPQFNNGSEARVCPGLNPCWEIVQGAFIGANLTAQPFDFNATVAQVYGTNCTTAVPTQDTTTSEDCLFLDVMVPDAIFAKRTSRWDQGAPVLVWIYGGAFTGGSKTYWGNPAGLIAASKAAGSEGIIFVAFNYRLGTLGFMFGAEFVQSGGLVNAGLYDQRLALDWIQRNIHLFGGDPNRMTVIGESAGGSSILFHALHKPAPFAQAILQSPAWVSDFSPSHQDATFKTYLGILGVSNLQEARNLPSEAVINANYLLIAATPYGTIPVGPVIDGLFLPDDPHRLLSGGYFDSRVKVITGFNGNEGLIFTPPNVTTDLEFSQYVTTFTPDANQTLHDYITTELYPPKFDGTLPYATQFERAELFFAEYLSICNAPAINRVALQPSYIYEFNVYPGAHVQDIAYTFFNGLGSEGPAGTFGDFNVTVAEIMQSYITSFAQNGDPNSGSGTPRFDPYDSEHVLQFSNNGIGQIQDPNANKRCEFWQKAPYH